jgi:hypothetical protein
VITPAIALEYLERQASNRTLSETTVARYTADMRAGRWVNENGQTIAFNKEDRLIDGQHRLYGVVRSGIPQEFDVARNCDERAFHTIDTGKLRKTSDIFSILGYDYTHVLASAARLSYAYIRGASLSEPVSRGQLVDFVDQHPYIVDAARLVRSSKIRFPNGPLASVVFLANEGRKFDAKIETFITGVRTGENLFRGDPRYALREWEREERGARRRTINTGTALTATIRCWNAYAANRELTVIKQLSAYPTRDGYDILGYDQARYPDVPVFVPLNAQQRIAPAHAALKSKTNEERVAPLRKSWEGKSGSERTAPARAAMAAKRAAKKTAEPINA